MNAALPELLLDQSFEDFGSCMEAVPWDMDFRQLDTGRLNAQVTVIGGRNVQLGRFHFNRRFHQLGSPPKGMMTFGFPDPDTSDFSWRGGRTTGGSLLNFNLSGGLDCVSDAGFTGYFAVHRPEYLQQLAEQLEVSAPIESLVAGKAQYRSSNTLAMSRKLNSLFQAADRTGNRNLAEYADLINEDVAIAIIGELAAPSTEPGCMSAPYKARILGRALDILNEADELPITVAQLCSRIGTSSSSLNRIFLSAYGISPKTYIRSRCLSAVRDELVCAPADTRVADIANKWGFWHMGQFAKDFRASFGDLPSQLRCQSSFGNQ